MTTEIFILRCKELGFSMDELDLIDFGFVNDMMVEKYNDQFDYPVKASQEDFDRFRST